MNAKTVTSAVLVGLWWVCAAAHGQETFAPGVQPPPIKRQPPAVSEPGPVPQDGAATSVVLAAPTGLSDWIRRPDTYPYGAPMPLYTELFVRAGPSIPVGGNYLGRGLQVGWSFEGGVRALLFNQDLTRAWTAEVHIVNSYNSGIDKGDPVALSIFQEDPTSVLGATLSDVPVTVRGYNRTMVGLGIGREFFLLGDADTPSGKWRAGIDGGGRYGSASMTYNEIRHRTNVVGGVYAAAHTDYEIPYDRYVFTLGLRCEWAYTWGDIMQFGNDIQEINVFVGVGVRF